MYREKTTYSLVAVVARGGELRALDTPQGKIRSLALTRVPGRGGGLGTARPQSCVAAHLRRGALG